MQRVAMKELIPERTSSKPLVFRLDGTNVDQVPRDSRAAPVGYGYAYGPSPCASHAACEVTSSGVTRTDPSDSI